MNETATKLVDVLEAKLATGQGLFSISMTDDHARSILAALKAHAALLEACNDMATFLHRVHPILITAKWGDAVPGILERVGAAIALAEPEK